MLILARAIQGFGAALMTPQTQAMIVRIFPPDRRGAAIGLWGSVAGLGVLTGPILGGFLVQSAGWQAIFLINVPVGVVGVILAWRLLPTLPRLKVSFDWIGTVMSAVGIFLIVYGLQEGVANHWGPVWGPITIPHIIIIGFVLVSGFVIHQAKSSRPLIPLRLFRDRDFSIANAAYFLVSAAMAGMPLPLLYFTQVARGLSPVLSAAFIVPTAVVAGILSPVVGGKIVARVGANRVACFGTACMALSLVWYLFFFTPTSPIWWALLPSCLAGVGNACMWAPVGMSATHRLPPADAGAGSGVYNALGELGIAVGAASMGALMNARLLAAGIPPESAGTANLPAEVLPGYITAMAESLLLPCIILFAAAALAIFLTGQAGRSPNLSDHP
jgi:EmrB/QacA subfamily drug resistance transporter